jgi:hypothetical protein
VNAMSTVPKKQPVEPELDPSVREQQERSRDALDNVREDYGGDETPGMPDDATDADGARTRRRRPV